MLGLGRGPPTLVLSRGSGARRLGRADRPQHAGLARQPQPREPRRRQGPGPGRVGRSDEPIVHSMLGSLASRSHASPADGRVPARDESAASDEPIVHSMLGLLASRSHESSAEAGVSGRDEPEDSDEPIRGLFGSLASAAVARPDEAEEPEQRSFPFVDSGVAARKRSESSVKPLIVHSTLAELAGLEEHAVARLSDRASDPHLARARTCCSSSFSSSFRRGARRPRPTSSTRSRRRCTPPKDESPIPIDFRDLPGAPRENPKRSTALRRRPARGRRRPGPAQGRHAVRPARSRHRGSRSRARARPGVPGAQAQAKARRGEAQPRREAEQRAALETADPSDRAQGLGVPGRHAALALERAARSHEARRPRRGDPRRPRAGPWAAKVEPRSPTRTAASSTSGRVSFETSWYDWGPYAAEMIRRIKLHWRIARDLLLLQQNGSDADRLLDPGRRERRGRPRSSVRRRFRPTPTPPCRRSSSPTRSGRCRRTS